MTTKQKYYASIGIIVVLFAMLWVFGVQKTLNLRSELETNETLERRIRNADILIRDYQKSIDLYGDVDSSYIGYSEEGLFNHIEDIARKNRCVILSYVPQADNQLDNAMIKTKKVEVKGGYFDLVKMLHALESNNASITKVLSSKLEMIENRKTRKTYLVLEVYIQNIIMS